MAAVAEGADEEVLGAEEEEEKSGGGGSKKLLLIGLPLLLIAGGAGAYFAGLLPIGQEEVPVEELEADPEPAFATTVIRPLDPFIANLADESAGRYIKTTIQLEFSGTEPPAWFDARMPQIRDLILTLLTSKSFDDIRTPEGKQILREEMIRRTNQALQADAVRAVYFTEFIVQ